MWFYVIFSDFIWFLVILCDFYVILCDFYVIFSDF